MAADFDQHLVDKLGYRIPDRLAEALGAWLEARPRPRRVLDLGCGTGLVADALRGSFDEMHGVDLSPRMVEQARARKLYATVEAGELLAFLAARPAQAADLVVAADVFVYVGDISAVIPAAFRVLRQGGVLIFSCELADESEGALVLRPSRRYAHSRRSVEDLCRDAGFARCVVEPFDLRLEANVPVAGFIAVAEKA